MFVSFIVIGAIGIAVANYTRKSWPRNIYDGFIYICCAAILLDYFF